ncbi:MAG TPA: hypothetical protein VG075_15095 [Candidatus Acidoferrum sp.]|jgi:hypothetical protein|nr:hypothetical protein [Candidatus Acidoferrum sp.]
MAPRHRFFGRFLDFLLLGTLVFFAAPFSPAQQATPTPATVSPSVGTTNPEFLATADEVVKEMSQITGWAIKTPLKKSIRSREDIHAYVLKQMDDEKDAKERYASARSAEAFGLIPKGFNFDSFLVDLLTEQIAGLYDPKAHEFYIADWIPADEQRMVMAHELTHALQDQQFDIEPWAHAARPNDDAEMAREAVLEGSAMAGMLEYELRGKGLKLRDLPEFDPSVFVGDLAETPILKKAPPFIKDSLMFPYFSGLTFSMDVLKSGGWPAFSSVFARPPANTQQILHPELYFANKAPASLKADLPSAAPGENWVLLEENSLGELGWKEVFKQFLGEPRAKAMAAEWDGDAYATFEQKNSKRLMLFVRIRLADTVSASRFFTEYAEALEQKYPDRTDVARRPNFLTFDSGQGSVFFRCSGKECISLEGGSSGLFLQWTAKLNWRLIPENPQPRTSNDIRTAQTNTLAMGFDSIAAF